MIFWLFVCIYLLFIIGISIGMCIIGKEFNEIQFAITMILAAIASFVLAIFINKAMIAHDNQVIHDYIEGKYIPEQKDTTTFYIYSDIDYD